MGIHSDSNFTASFQILKRQREYVDVYLATLLLHANFSSVFDTHAYKYASKHKENVLILISIKQQLPLN